MTRLNTLVAVLLAATAFTSVAQAADTTTTRTTSYHSETYYHWNPLAQDTTGFYVSGAAGGAFPTDDFDNDGVYKVSLGWQFHPMMRAEIEGGYRNLDTDGAGSGDADVWTAMFNGIFDIKNDTMFTPYIGVGIGYAYENLDANAAAGGNNNESAFAYQGIAGVSFNIDNNWAVTAQYNYIDTTNFDYSAHEVTGGLRYTF